jgi:hypothetical protein
MFDDARYVDSYMESTYTILQMNDDYTFHHSLRSNTNVTFGPDVSIDFDHSKPPPMCIGIRNEKRREFVLLINLVSARNTPSKNIGSIKSDTKSGVKSWRSFCIKGKEKQ